jgi:antitoxin component of MazEF toxin-antitoxin module
MAKQKIIRTGNSLAVTIPADFARAVGIKAGQEVLAKSKPENGQMVYTFFGAKQLPLSKSFIKRGKT